MEKYYLAYAHLRVILCSLSSSWTWTGILTIGIHRGRKNLIANQYASEANSQVEPNTLPTA